MALSVTSVSNPGAASFADGANPTAFAGKQGETLTSDVHGKYYTAAYRGKVFSATTAAAGTTIPISSATAATFVLHNPLGSGINVEVISYDMGVTQLTLVVSPILFGVNQNVLINPTGVTAATVVPGLAGSGQSSIARCYTVATVVASTLFFTVGHISSTSNTAAITPMSNFHYEFDGRLNLGPGCLIHVCGTAAQSGASAQTFSWAEWPA